MNLDVFPGALRTKNIYEVNEARRLLKKEYNAKSVILEVDIEEIEKRHFDPKFRRSLMTETWGSRGAILGFFLFLYSAINVSFMSGIFIWALCFGGGWLYGFVSYRAKYNSDMEEKEQLKAKLRQLSEDLKRQSEEIKEKADREFNEYLKQFEEAAKERSLNYADSSLTEKVAEWAYNEMAREINDADRAASEKDIYVSSSLLVFADKIEFNKKSYDFKENRLQSIPTPIDQAAIARVIATKINLQLVSNYAKDPSGTDSTIRLNYDYNEHEAIVEFEYMADNGKYITETAW